jgi:PhnB protein
MPQNPPANMPRIAANVFYDDLGEALDWLTKSFGFQTRMTVPGEDGKPMHAEMDVYDSMIMLGPTSAQADWAAPNSIGGQVTMTLYVYVDDVEDHYASAKAAGAEIVSEPETMFWGDRTYVARDHAGHRWTFAQVVKDPE